MGLSQRPANTVSVKFSYLSQPIVACPREWLALKTGCLFITQCSFYNFLEKLPPPTPPPPESVSKSLASIVALGYEEAKNEICSSTAIMWSC